MILLIILSTLVNAIARYNATTKSVGRIPSVVISESKRAELGEAAVRAAQAVGIVMLARSSFYGGHWGVLFHGNEHSNSSGTPDHRNGDKH